MGTERWIDRVGVAISLPLRYEPEYLLRHNRNLCFDSSPSTEPMAGIESTEMQKMEQAKSVLPHHSFEFPHFLHKGGKLGRVDVGEPVRAALLDERLHRLPESA